MLRRIAFESDAAVVADEDAASRYLSRVGGESAAVEAVVDAAPAGAQEVLAEANDEVELAREYSRSCEARMT